MASPSKTMTLTEIRDGLDTARTALLAYQTALPENPAMLQKAGRACMAVTALHAYLGNRLDPYAPTGSGLQANQRPSN